MIPKVRAAAIRALKRASISAIEIVRRRTAQGIDVNGAPFAPYSRQYRNMKLASGRRVLPPDLTLSGEMLRGIQVLADSASPVPTVVLGWGRAMHRQFVWKTRKKKAFSNRDSHRAVRARVLSRSKDQQSRVVETNEIVIRLQRKRKFFDIKLPSEIAELVRVIERVMGEELKQLLLR